VRFKVHQGQALWLTAVISVTREVEIRRITVQGQPRQKICETRSQLIKAECAVILVIRVRNRRLMGVKERPYWKNNKAKKTEGVVQVVQHQYQALSSNPST
jgi:hypothetical protein